MNDEILEKIDEIIRVLDESKAIEELELLKKRILSDKELLAKIEKVKKEDTYNEQYVKLKGEILSNSDFKRYKKIEEDLYLLICEVNNKINTLTKEKHENN